jgi:uncharacterized protein
VSVSAAATATGVVDCDVHIALPSIETLYPYLGGHWPEFLSTSAGKAPASLPITYPQGYPSLATRASDTTLELLQAGPLAGAEKAIVSCYWGVESFTHPYLAAELAGALNKWIATEWLDLDDRLRASAVIAPQFTEGAVQEIERIADDRRFVQLLVPAASRDAYGDRRYWPIWEAAAEHGLVLGLAFGGGSGGPPTPVNWLGSFFEHYAVAMLGFETQLASLILSGVFNRWPTLRVTVVESGWTWLPGYLWRLDAEWKQHKREVPWLEEPPSSYVRRHFRFTTQPSDVPADAGQLAEALAQIGGGEIPPERLLLYASDFPHRYGDGADRLLDALSEEQLERVLRANAAEWYPRL